MNKQTTRRRFIAALAVLAALGVVAAVVLHKRQALSNKDDVEVIVYIGNRVYSRVGLGEQTIVVDQGSGAVNHVRVLADRVYMEHASCNNQDCIKQGEVSLDNYNTRPLYEWIVCLPNQVSVQFSVGGAP